MRKDQLIRQVYADQTSQSYGYNEQGQVRSITDELGQVTRLSYDENNDLVSGDSNTMQYCLFMV